MNRIKAFGAFWYDFVIGDDWQVAALVVAGLALTAVLAHAAKVNAWWLLPLFVFAALGWSLHRATKSPKLSRTKAWRLSLAKQAGHRAGQPGVHDAPGLAADIRTEEGVPAGPAQVAGELHRVRRGTVRRRPWPAARVVLEGPPEPWSERRGEIRLNVRHAAAALAHQSCRLHPHPVTVHTRRGLRPGHQGGDQLMLARRKLRPSPVRQRTGPTRRMLSPLAGLTHGSPGAH